MSVLHNETGKGADAARTVFMQHRPSSGISIALDLIGPSLMEQAAVEYFDPALLHRVVALATGGLDTLRHNGTVITLLGISGISHRQAYGDIFVVAVLVPKIACVLVIALGKALGSFRTTSHAQLS
ncbi:hypothetical protein [Pseudoruegeria sp. SK021]|uniref:hypothetical protein n=1 Tax=Pseudoruegeria sp. SK021 TaxID=1933035 RepID=UPI00197E3EB8|nr:hypothetical protein [Pseudoruegeria sp. SK021]